MGYETPCAKDFRETGRDWVELAPPLTRGDILEMTNLCNTQCRVREACYSLAARRPSGEFGSVGVWGGAFWRQGRPIELAAGPRKSLYEGVVWEERRGKWRAFAQQDGRFIGGAYWNEDQEDEAGENARMLRERHGIQTRSERVEARMDLLEEGAQ